MNSWNVKLKIVNEGHSKFQGSPPHVACRRRNGGFSLIEVLISMVIFSIAVLGLAIGAGTVMRANKTSYFSTIAVNLGQDKLEELKANPATHVPGPPVTDTVPVEGLDFQRTWTIGLFVVSGVTIPEVTQINVLVSWTDYITHNVTISSAVCTPGTLSCPN